MTAADLFTRAKRVYEERLQHQLECSNPNAFVAIEPDSGEYFLGQTLSEASAAAHAAYPDRRCCVLRVGHSVTVHIGAGQR
ncbi:MAG TPA: hypothetical protein VFE62_06625 [Gemmataceae bacterium]|nr:hypothetical protein [Gemmataceae bacterium]